MEPILIPSVPSEAFNKHRHISDLIRKQVEHFKHIEAKLPKNVRAKIPQHAIVTEDEAARYIHAMTTYLISRLQPKQPATKTDAAAKPPTPIRPRRPLTLAAAATPVLKKKAKKKSSAKKETPAAKKSQSIKPKARKPKARKTSSKRKK